MQVARSLQIKGLNLAESMTGLSGCLCFVQLACVLFFVLQSTIEAAEPSAPQTFTIVTTADGLNEALKRGDKHIEIQEHLVLSGIELIRDADFVFTPKTTTVSIRVRFLSSQYVI
jgi:hypothetical protein